jgi:hypothetical protein
LTFRRLFERAEDRPGVGLPELHALAGMMATRLLLDGVAAGDALERLLGDRRGLALDDVDELAADVGEAGELLAAP